MQVIVAGKEPLGMLLDDAMKRWAMRIRTDFYEEMRKAKEIAANSDIRAGLTHGEIVFGKVFDSDF